MWCEAGQEPDAFWHQTPLHFQIVMAGVRERNKAKGEVNVALAWQTAAFALQGQSKSGLKPLRHYLQKPARRMSEAEMLGNMKLIASRVNRKMKRGEK